MWPKRKTQRRVSDQIRTLTRGGILDEQAFWQIVRAEKERSDRSGIPVTVAVFTIKDDQEDDSAVAGRNAAPLCQLLRETARITDHIGIAGEHELGVLLWGTREQGAYRFVNRLGEHAQWLAARCNLFVYPELESPVMAPSEDTDGKLQLPKSKHSKIPQGILNRIAEVERQLETAIAVETPAEGSQELSDFNDKYSFGLNDSATELLEEIQASQDHLRKAQSPSDEDDSDDFQPPSSGGNGPAKASEHVGCASNSTGVATGAGVAAGESTACVAEPEAAIDVALTKCEAKQPDQASSSAAWKKGDYDMDVQLEPLENLFLHPFPRWKRIVDIAGAGIGLVLLSPLLLAVAALVKLTSPGPVLFRQLREGYGGELFQINKFRTMRVGADAEKAQLQAQNEQDGPAFKLKDDPRITSLGGFLRKTCLDELPQLWNVLLGNMTLVGPRPLDYRESRKIAQWGRRRLNVMPGLTCIWQVHGKSKVTFNEWMRMDIRYSQRVSFRHDMMLVFATLKQVLLRQASH